VMPKYLTDISDTFADGTVLLNTLLTVTIRFRVGFTAVSGVFTATNNYFQFFKVRLLPRVILRWAESTKTQTLTNYRRMPFCSQTNSIKSLLESIGVS